MSNLLEMPLVLAALAFMAGYVLAKLGAWFTRKEKTDGKHDPDRDRQYRGMEADLRVARKQLEQAETDMAAVKQERGELQAELDDRGGELLEATSQLEDLRGQLKDECDKTQGLRSELSNRAEEGIRAQVQLRDAETELSLAQAGSDAVNDEISQLVGEREQLEERLADLQRLQAAQRAEEPAEAQPRRRHEDLVEETHPRRRSSDMAVDG